MSRYHSYLNSARDILLSYKGDEPFASFIKKEFARHKKFGSTDRRQISHLCYCYFRMGKAAQDLAIEEKILTALFLCSTAPDMMLGALKPDWNVNTDLPIREKLTLVNLNDLEENLFPGKDGLNDEIEKDQFVLSHLVQPDLFLRLRPGKQDSTKNKLTNGAISFKNFSPDCLAIPNSSKIDSVIELDKEAVVQDYSSQQVGEYIKIAIDHAVNVWDCCAGSGGKSIMAYDLKPSIHLTVSDRRESILVNLKKRFREAGISNFDSKLLDVSSPLPADTGRKNEIDLIIADVPCSGSGTWGRTPEQLVFFEEDKILEYAALQKKITGNVIQQLKPGGYFLYITCSVYKKENEEIVQHILKNPAMELVKSDTLKGYLVKADTMFVALFRNTREYRKER